MQPSFETARLLLRPRTLDDLDACLAMDRDPEVMRFVDGPWLDPAAHRDFIVERMTAAYPDGLGYWSVAAKDAPARLLGWILLIPLDLHGPEIETGWRFIPTARGKGYATEAAAAVLRHGFETQRLPEIVADIHPDNRRSIRVAEKLGLRFAGPRRYERWMASRFVLKREDFRPVA